MRINPGPDTSIDGSCGAGYPPLGEMSSMTAGFEMDAAAMAAGMMLDTMAGTLSYGQHASQPNPPPGMGYGLVGMEGPAGGSMNGYRGLAMDTTGLSAMGNNASGSSNRGGPSGQQLGHAGLQGQGQQQDMSYQFVDNDTIAMWSTAPTGFELDEWGTYLTNVSELTQHSHQPGGAGNPGGNSMHQSHLT
ncbi:hypothetical protein HYPSUDRAFT_167885 [Hypholoma sublateritium FD-334 SS-4]|uniref:Uncharacterized protein n=1 Tax=Hypholoma sublateritium (strain FD-334 SS-4) TaxID=945553 RepID=A0A0D2NLS6_HYPSF|nr:hypothetical protein HYPSUDRAFT_167885 [Hypholoma sublateritium FD-334 SS-4]